jgi:polysaccharide biosynthesis protein PslG
MTRKLILFAALVLLALPATASAYLPAGFIGISPQNPASAKDYALMREAGISSVRLPLNWRSIQEEGSLDFNWTGFDHEVMLAAEENIRVMPFVAGTPAWAAPEWKVLPVRSSFQRWAWRTFLRAAVERYGPEGEFWEENPDLEYMPINKWEIWNEENIVSFAERPDPAPFAVLIRIAGQALHGVDPSARVIVGGLFGRPLQIPPNVASGDYLNRLYAAGNVKPYFDGVALHPYVADAKAMGTQLTNLRRIMRLHGDAKTPIYLTELGWGSQSGPTRWERGLYGQANQLTKSFEMLSAQRRRWGVAGLWWFTWTDEGGTCVFCHSAGLLTEDRKAKPSWYRFTAWTGGDPDAVPRANFGNDVELGEEQVVVPGD